MRVNSSLEAMGLLSDKCSTHLCTAITKYNRRLKICKKPGHPGIFIAEEINGDVHIIQLADDSFILLPQDKNGFEEAYPINHINFFFEER